MTRNEDTRPSRLIKADHTQCRVYFSDGSETLESLPSEVVFDLSADLTDWWIREISPAYPLTASGDIQAIRVVPETVAKHV